MLCEKIQGTLEDFPDKTVDYVDVEWYEVFKKLHKKLSHHGVEIGIRLDNGVLTHGLWQDDVLGVEGDTVYVVNIPPCEVLAVRVDAHHPRMAEKVCYEIGNKHAALFWGESEGEFITPYNAPLEEKLKRLHGVTVERMVRKLDFSRAISATINAHTH